MLLDACADPDARQAGGVTALHATAQHDDDALAALLLRHGADPSLRNDNGADAEGIARACQCGCRARVAGRCDRLTLSRRSGPCRSSAPAPARAR
ncbi:MAG: hypothetical protein H0U06_00640 [Solirubrobacterales bacterium]|nr:hypothetical protein [Solirubrobacterales bacterium]